VLAPARWGKTTGASPWVRITRERRSGANPPDACAPTASRLSSRMSHLDDHALEALRVDDVETLVERYAPELRPTPSMDGGGVTFVTGVAALFNGAMASEALGGLAALLAMLGTALLGVWFHVRLRRRAAAAFDELLRERPWEVYAGIASRFRRDLEGQHRRLLGPGSEWGRARSPLEEALDEARRSLAYWKARVEQDPEQPAAREHEATARQLALKFERALAELDGRSRTLRDFFHACEARLSSLEFSRRDAEESHRLARLSDRADDVTYDASRAMASTGRDVLRQVIEVAQALGAAERLAIQHTAGDVPIERIEAVADRILASADEERRALAGIVAHVGDTLPP
jgi:hypothetical protein